MKEHGVLSVVWTNLGGGWIVECECGFTTSPDHLLEICGREFDEHLESEGVLAK